MCSVGRGELEPHLVEAAQMPGRWSQVRKPWLSFLTLALFIAYSQLTLALQNYTWLAVG